MSISYIEELSNIINEEIFNEGNTKPIELINNALKACNRIFPNSIIPKSIGLNKFKTLSDWNSYFTFYHNAQSYNHEDKYLIQYSNNNITSTNNLATVISKIYFCYENNPTKNLKKRPSTKSIEKFISKYNKSYIQTKIKEAENF